MITARASRRLLAAAACLWLASCGAETPANVVWIVIDAQRADRLGTYGYERDTSPVLDALAEEGVVFENAMAQESYTHASVPSYLTSTYPLTNRVIYEQPTMDVLDDRFVTIAEVLDEAGYLTAGIVFNPHLQGQFGFNQGFDEYHEPDERWEQGGRHYSAYETATRIEEKTRRILQGRAGEPVFLYLHYLDVHDPYMPPPPYHAIFLPESREPVVDVLYPESGNLRLDRYPRLVRSQYDGGVRYMDHALGKLLEMLAEHDVTRDNTVFVFTADHGEEFFDRHPGDRGGNYHGRTLYREQIHVPLIFLFPEEELAGARIAKPVALVDIVPTLVDYLGFDVEAFEQFQGRSLLPLLRGDDGERSLVYSGGNHHRAALISGRFKFYRNDRRLKRNRRANFERPEDAAEYEFADELYDIEADPKETRNVIDEYPEIADRFREELRRLTVELSRDSRTRSTEIDETTRRQLEALGYIDP